MKTKILNALAIMTLITMWCAAARAQLPPLSDQLIYSNSFNGPFVSVESTAPTYVSADAGNYGGNSAAVWTDTFTNFLNDTVDLQCQTLYQNGSIATNLGSALLPLTVKPNAVYILNAQIQLPGATIYDTLCLGFALTNCAEVNFTNVGLARFADNPPGGEDWIAFKNNQDPTFYAGTGTTAGQNGSLFIPPGTVNLQIILDTLLNTNQFSITNAVGHPATNYWIGTAYTNGVQLGTNIFYANPPLIQFCGLGQFKYQNMSVSGIQWNYFTASTPLLPFISQQPTPAAGTANQGANYTFAMTALADTNGGTIFYQWYTNGVPLSNGGNISGATNASLLITGVTASDTGTNYYVVVTNAYGAITSSPASLIVFSSPTFTSAFPITYTNLGTTNLMYLYGGSGAYSGSSPSFSVSAIGAQPIGYFWLTNGVPVGGATSTNFTIANLPITGPITFACVASNVAGKATNIWMATYLPSPTTPFQAAVMTAQPLAYWRLNDTNLDGVDNDNGDDGYVCHDYESGHDGIYTNVILGSFPSSGESYSPVTDPLESSAQFGTFSENIPPYSDANSIGDNNLDFSSSSNGEFTVALWANGSANQGHEPPNAGLFAKGYIGAEECVLNCDPSHYHLEFNVQNSLGVVSTAGSSEDLGNDPNWHFIVGVCDETNGTVSLYIDGALVSSATIVPGSGIINAAATPILIGAMGATSTDPGSLQFGGNLNDVALYGYAMTPNQITNQYAASGYTNAPYLNFISPPPSSFQFEPSTTLTLPAMAFGTPPLGYYWTNVTAGGAVLGSGVTNVYADLNATLTIPNAPGSLSGDQVELVVTNASGSATRFVTLSIPTPLPTPVTLSYTNPILYSNSFTPGALKVSINGMPLSAVNSLVGGTNTTWTCTYSNNAANNGTIYTDGTLGTNQGEALVPFTPEPGFIYTMIGSITESNAPYDYIHIGFSEFNGSSVGFTNLATDRFNDNPPDGFAFEAANANIDTLYPGPETANGIAGSMSPPSVYPATNIFQIVLVTTNSQWTVSGALNGAAIGTNTYAIGNNPPIAYAGIGQQQFSGAPPTGLQWNYWTITAVSPNGYPPYLLAPLPPTSTITLTNPTVTLNASAIGTGPWGYYWINNSTIIASGSTNNTAPVIANLSVPSSSLSGGSLELVLTNALGTNITSITLTAPANPNPSIAATVTNGVLYLTWPVANLGYQLQAQTNPVSKGLSTNWANYNPSTGTNRVVIPINLTNGTVFYRLTN